MLGAVEEFQLGEVILVQCEDVDGGVELADAPDVGKGHAENGTEDSTQDGTVADDDEGAARVLGAELAQTALLTPDAARHGEARASRRQYDQRRTQDLDHLHSSFLP